MVTNQLNLTGGTLDGDLNISGSNGSGKPALTLIRLPFVFDGTTRYKLFHHMSECLFINRSQILMNFISTYGSIITDSLREV